MILSHKIALDPTVKQRIAFARATGVARFTWNWALAEWDRQYKAGEKPNAAKLKALWNEIKGERFPWVYDSPKGANQQPFTYLQKAFSDFFKKRARHPTYKKKGVHDSFYVENDKFHLDGKTVVLPKIGRVRLREALRFSGRITSATVSRETDRWFISVQVDVGNLHHERTGDGIVGVDLGLTTTATLSTGEKVNSPKALRAALRSLRRAQRSLSRRKKGSHRREKAKRRVARIYRRVRDVRKDFLHKLTTRLCKNHAVVVIEDLAVSNMMKNHRLARSLSDASFGEARRQLIYKAPIYETEVVVADRWFPSSKTCHVCGKIKDDLRLSDRLFRCECGWVEDRDVNAAMNLATLGLRGSHARGEATAVSNLVEPRTKPRPLVGTH